MTARLRSNRDWSGWWTETTRFYAWHLTVEDTAVPRLVARYHRALRDLEGLELVPVNWLHLTVHGVGLVEDVSTEARDRMVEAVAGELAAEPAPAVEFGDWVVDHGTIGLRLVSAEPFHTIRAAVRRGMIGALGADGVAEPADGCQPHLTLAFLTADQASGPLLRRLTGVAAQPLTVRVRTASLLEMYRTRQAYQWRRIAEARLCARRR